MLVSGLTTSQKRFDYVMAAFNWWNPESAGGCAFPVRSYVKPAKGLASHRPVVALLQRGLGGADCGGEPDGVEDDGSDLGFGYDTCSSDGDCASDPIYNLCVDGYCSECKTDADCTDPDYPICNEAFECN